MPSLRFFHSEELRAQTLELLADLELSEDPTRFRGALGDLVVRLTDAGLAYYFLKPLELAEMGIIVRQSAKLGVASGLRLISPVIRTIIGRMDKAQLLAVCGFMRQLMK